MSIPNTVEYNACTYLPIISMPLPPMIDRTSSGHLQLARSRTCTANQIDRDYSAGGGGGAVHVGLHLAPVEAAVAPAGGAHERRGRALRARRHELPAPVHGVPADGRRVVALALPVLHVHHLRLLPRRRAVRHGTPPILLRTHIYGGRVDVW